MENSFKLEPEVKEKWVEALRSGDYIQTESVLYDGKTEEGKPRMCCLGVLEHIMGNELDAMYDKDQGDRYAVPGNLAQPKSVFGLNSSHIQEIEDVEAYLVNMNDGNTQKNIKKHSFEEIADYIEKNL